jgi:hypothetical protein
VVRIENAPARELSCYEILWLARVSIPSQLSSSGIQERHHAERRPLSPTEVSEPPRVSLMPLGYGKAGPRPSSALRQLRAGFKRIESRTSSGPVSAHAWATRKRDHVSLPGVDVQPSRQAAGRLYLLAFDNGVVKAGRSADPKSRWAQHRRDAGKFGLTIVNRWYSEPVGRSDLLERLWLNLLKEVALPTTAGREYFRGVPFTIAKHFGEAIAGGLRREVHCMTCTCGFSPSIKRIRAAVASTPVLRDNGRRDELDVEFVFQCGMSLNIEVTDPAHYGPG